MKVELLNYTPLYIADKAIGKCWDKPTPDEEVDIYNEDVDYASLPTWVIEQKMLAERSRIQRDGITKPGCNTERIERVALKNKHASTIEHLNYTFDIDGVSRALLQELARHRIASYSVKSTRYTLKELKCEQSFTIEGGVICHDKERASKYVVFTGNDYVDTCIINSLEELRKLVIYSISNDIVKYSIPEAYKTSLVWTINARSLQNFLALRSSKDALWEIRELALEIYKQIPEDHKFLFKDFVKETQ